MSQSPGVAVGALLQGWSEHAGLTLDLLAGAGGLERRITSPHVQKTGLALAGFEKRNEIGEREEGKKRNKRKRERKKRKKERSRERDKKM